MAEMALRGQIGGLFLGLSTQFDQARAAAWLLRRSLRVWGNAEAKYRVLCIQRSIFEDDVRAMAERSDDVCFGMLPKGKLHDIFRYFVDRHPEKDELTEFNYHHGCCRDALDAYGTFMEKVLCIFRDLWRFDALLSGNFGYLQQQEVLRIVEERGIPFVTLFKEGLVIPAYLPDLAKKLIDGKKFAGSKIIFYSEQIREAVLKSNAFEGAQFDVAVSGIPRMDCLAEAKPPDAKRIVLFSFYPRDKFRCFDSEPETMKQACEAADRFHRMIYRFAAEHPDWELCVKTKVGSRYVDYARDLLNLELGEKPPNVRVTNAGAAVDMILDSTVVAAFQSTTAIEALVAGRTVVCPDLSAYFGDEPWDYFQDRPELVSYVRSTEDFEKVMRNAGLQDNNAQQGDRDEFLRQMVHGADGMASQRAVDEIIATIEKSRQSPEL